jgi:hypothetical protein
MITVTKNNAPYGIFASKELASYLVPALGFFNVTSFEFGRDAGYSNYFRVVESTDDVNQEFNIKAVLKEALKDAGFDVLHIENATRAEIEINEHIRFEEPKLIAQAANLILSGYDSYRIAHVLVAVLSLMPDVKREKYYTMVMI